MKKSQINDFDDKVLDKLIKLFEKKLDFKTKSFFITLDEDKENYSFSVHVDKKAFEKKRKKFKAK